MAEPDVHEDPAPHSPSARLERTFCLYDFALSPFTNTTLLIPVLITELAKRSASPWGERYASADCIQCSDFTSAAASLVNATRDACNTESDAQCMFNASAALCQEVADTCTPSSDNKCCIKDPASLTVPFFGMQANYSSVFAYCATISVLLQIMVLVGVGPLADYHYYHKRLFVASTIICFSAVTLVVTCAEAPWEITAILFIIGNVAFGLADVLYNAYIPKLFPPNRYDPIGAKGFMAGQLGAQLCLFLTFVPLMGISSCGLWGLSAALGVSGVWMAIFSMPFLYAAPYKDETQIPVGQSIGMTILKDNLALRRVVVAYPEVGKFLLSYFVFSDGYSTITEMAPVFASEVLCFEFEELIILIILVEFSAVLGVSIFVSLTERYNLRIRTAMLVNLCSISIIPLLALPSFRAFSSEYKWTFYTAAIPFGFNLGSIQALARTYYARLLPLGLEARMFSLFEITAKGTSWLGPMVVAVVKDATGDFQLGFFSMTFFFLIGLVLLLRVDEVKGARDAGRADSNNQLMGSCPVPPAVVGAVEEPADGGVVPEAPSSKSEDR